MARLARVVVPDLPHHVSQRGNRREPLFFEADDYRLYRRLVAAAARRAGTAVWAYCLMPNHVHLPIMPTWRDAGGRGRVAGELCRSAPALHRGHQRSLPVDEPSVPGPLWGGSDGPSARDRILDQLVVFGGITPLPEVKAGMKCDREGHSPRDR